MINAKMSFAIALFLTCSAIAGSVPRVLAERPAGFAVEFSNCVESIGVGLVPTEQARALVPAEFQLVGEGGPMTPLVVRTARCNGIAVAGPRPKAGSIVQLGVVIVPPDFTGDINNYTLWYYTSDAKLAHHLARLGVRAQHVPTIDYDYGSDGSFFVNVPRPGRPLVSVDGTVVEPENSSGSFVANWWAIVDGCRVKMETNVPEIFIGDANLTLTTNPNGPLGQLIGGASTGFPVLQQFNTFADARMTVRVNSR